MECHKVLVVTIKNSPWKKCRFYSNLMFKFMILINAFGSHERNLVNHSILYLPPNFVSVLALSLYFGICSSKRLMISTSGSESPLHSSGLEKIILAWTIAWMKWWEAIQCKLYDRNWIKKKKKKKLNNSIL